MHKPSDTDISFVGTYTGKIKNCTHPKTLVQVFIAYKYVIVKNWKSSTWEAEAEGLQ